MGDWLHVGCLSALADRCSDTGACARARARAGSVREVCSQVNIVGANVGAK